MFAQLEGVIAEASNHHGRFSERKLVEYLAPIAERGTRFERFDARLVVGEIWQGFEYGDPLPQLSRHAILHGADTGYGTPANSLKAILYFDSIRKGLAKLAA